MSILYATDNDMGNACSQVLSIGQDFTDCHEWAARKINRDLEIKWYRPQCEQRGIDWTDVPFDPTKLVDVEELKDLGVAKALQRAGMILTQNPGTKDARDQWQEIRDYFAVEYESELERVLSYGLEYTWSTTDDAVSAQPKRRLRRA